MILAWEWCHCLCFFPFFFFFPSFFLGGGHGRREMRNEERGPTSSEVGRRRAVPWRCRGRPGLGLVKVLLPFPKIHP